MTQYGAANHQFNPINLAEDKIIRHLAAKGLSAREMSIEGRDLGLNRNHVTIRLYMTQHNIQINADSMKLRRQARPRAVPARIGFIPGYRFIAPNEANDAFAAAWAASHGDQIYQDHPKASKGKDAFTMKRPSATGFMTTGGVAVYG